MLACKNGLEMVVLQMLDIFGENCKPKQTNLEVENALYVAYMNNMHYATNKLIEKFGSKCKPVYFDNLQKLVDRVYKEIMDYRFKYQCQYILYQHAQNISGNM